jgi:hypothetical protein
MTYYQYTTQTTHIQTILKQFNALHQNLDFTAETETDNKIHYLDITIHRTSKNWNISIYRKPTFTDTIIPYTSNNPTQHKFTAVRFMYNRLNTLLPSILVQTQVRVWRLRGRGVLTVCANDPTQLRSGWAGG